MVLDRPWIGRLYELVPLGYGRDVWVRRIAGGNPNV
jgi:hypothetical protein